MTLGLKEIQYNKPVIDQDDIAPIESVLRSRWLARGEKVSFERQLLWTVDSSM
jgi:dTDP-4-amino-4,6-dideoxygalactose transaminase